nr:sirohydrochlorin cobaltochelatase [Desulforamulus aquiferis]
MNHSRDTAILLVTFGTNVTQAATSFKNLEDKVKETFPNIEVRWAYTAKSIRQRLGKMGFHYDSPVTALARLQDEGYTRVAVQSVHMIAGQEYYDLVNVVENMSHLRGISGHNFHPKLANLALKN